MKAQSIKVKDVLVSKIDGKYNKIKFINPVILTCDFGFQTTPDELIGGANISVKNDCIYANLHICRPVADLELMYPYLGGKIDNEGCFIVTNVSLGEDKNVDESIPMIKIEQIEQNIDSKIVTSVFINGKDVIIEEREIDYKDYLVFDMVFHLEHYEKLKTNVLYTNEEITNVQV